MGGYKDLGPHRDIPNAYRTAHGFPAGLNSMEMDQKSAHSVEDDIGGGLNMTERSADSQSQSKKRSKNDIMRAMEHTRKRLNKS